MLLTNVIAGGTCLAIGNAVAEVGPVALLAALEVQVRLVEEPYLRRAHGQAYVAFG